MINTLIAVAMVLMSQPVLGGLKMDEKSKPSVDPRWGEGISKELHDELTKAKEKEVKKAPKEAIK